MWEPDTWSWFDENWHQEQTGAQYPTRSEVQESCGPEYAMYMHEPRLKNAKIDPFRIVFP